MGKSTGVNKANPWAEVDLTPLPLREDTIRRATEAAVSRFWTVRRDQAEDQEQRGRVRDAGTRSEVTGGQHMNDLVALFCRVALNVGVSGNQVFMKDRLVLPGFFRATKKWDLLVIRDCSDGSKELVALVEAKGIASSFGNNLNNRTEEAVGSAHDCRRAVETGRIRAAASFWRGYLLLMADVEESRSEVRVLEPHFEVDPALKGRSYLERGLELCRRVVSDGLYEGSAFIAADPVVPGRFREPDPDHGIFPLLRGFAAACRT